MIRASAEGKARTCYKSMIQFLNLVASDCCQMGSLFLSFTSRRNPSYYDMYFRYNTFVSMTSQYFEMSVACL